MNFNRLRVTEGRFCVRFLFKPASFRVFALCLLFVVGACSGNPAEQSLVKTPPATKPLPVKIATVVNKDMPIELRAVGIVEAFSQVEIRSQVTGVLEKIGFKEGAKVREGDLLFRIDERPFLSRLEQARATLAKDRAGLKNARKQVERYQPAAAKGYVSVEQLDLAQTSVETLAAAVQADEAVFQSARLDLDNCTIRSPLSGYTGELSADPGNLIKALDQAMVTINQTSPIKVSFTLPEQSLPEIKKHLAAGDMQVIADSTGVRLLGNLSFIDNQVNTSTGSIRLKADFANETRKLWPGQFVNIRLRLTVRKDAIVVPTRAVQASQTGDFIYVVGQDQRVEQRPVTVAFSEGDQTVIDSGVNVGEVLVTDGQLRLRAGATVKPLAESPTGLTPKAAQ